MRKLNKLRSTALLLLLLLLNFIASSQSLTFTQAMDSLLAPLDKSRVTTGILYERVKPLANIDLFNLPSADPYISDYSFFCQAYFELYNSAYNKSGWLKPSYLRASIGGEILQKKFNVGILDFQFNTIDSNAIQNATLTFSNGQFHDVQGQNPYWTKRLQVAAILADEINGGLVSFIYNPSFVKTNQSLTVSTIQLNFGTIGTYTLSPSNPIVQINFTGSGVKEFVVTVQYTNGTSFSQYF